MTPLSRNFPRIGKFATYLLVFAIGFWTGPQSDAADLGYRYFSSTTAVSNTATGFSSYVSSAAADYNNNTDLTVSFVTNATAVINFTQGNYGATNWEANSVSRNQYQEDCSTFQTGSLTGNCNTTDRKARYATIYINSYYSIPTTVRHWLTRHELGHALGMGHLDCNADAIMRQTRFCSTPPSSLRPYDISLINSWY